MYLISIDQVDMGVRYSNVGFCIVVRFTGDRSSSGRPKYTSKCDNVTSIPVTVSTSDIQSRRVIARTTV